MSNRIVIIGGVAAGASAAAKARRTDEHAEIDVFERGPYISFANCGLPYYIGGKIEDRKSLLIQTPASFWNRYRIKAHVRHEVQRIQRDSRTIVVRNLDSGEVFEQAYDRLILAPGASPVVPPIPGVRAENVFAIRTVPDSDAIRQFLKTQAPRRAVIVGAGFIGLETVECLRNAGLEVTLVDLLPQVAPLFDADMAGFIAEHVKASGVDIILGDGIKAFHGSPRASEVELASGRRLPVDLAVLSIGVKPELQLAEAAQLLIGPAGGIVVNERQQTSDPTIYAAGDAVEMVHLVTGKPVRIAMAGPANKQGRVAGANAAGASLAFPGALGTSIVETLGMTAAKTGLSEREAKAAGLPYYVSYTHSPDHATYYPGSEILHIKLVVEEGTQRLLGAQVVGEKGVDKRIDVFATALYAKLRVADIENLDLAYAPQFSSAKDAVIMAGSVATNVARQELETITYAGLRELLAQKADVQLVDVRTPAEFRQGAIPQAALIPLDELRDRLHELDPAKTTVVYCRVGLRGYMAVRVLRQEGFKKVLNLSGGILSVPPEVTMKERQEQSVSCGLATVSVERLQELLREPGVKVLDVREPDEFAYEHIAGTENWPLSSLADRLEDLPKNVTPVVLCLTGVRAREAVALLHRYGWGMVYDVQGGISAWKGRQWPTLRQRGPLPVMRQAQIVAGAMALVGGILPKAWWVAAFIGAGLVFAGLTGTCALARLLERMPWNRSRLPALSCGSNPGFGRR